MKTPWFFPLKNWDGQIPTGDHPGAFGYRRKHDVHTGVDLYVFTNDWVYAVEDGEVIRIEDFTGPSAGSPWWLPTKAILVQGDSGVVGYCEVDPFGLREGDYVDRGQTLAAVVPVLPQYKRRSDIPGHSNMMLHMELYKDGTTETVWWHVRPANLWSVDGSRPKNLLDPTEFLVEALANHGIRQP